MPRSSPLILLLVLFSSPLLLAQAADEKAAKRALAEYGKYGKNKNAHVRRAAVEDLGRTDHVLVTRKLLTCLKDRDEGVREAVISGLARQRNDLGLAELKKRVWRGRNKVERLAILGAWKAEPPASAWTIVADLLSARAWEIRARAAEVTSAYPDEEGRGTGALVPLLEDKEVPVRMAALLAMAKLQHPKSNRLVIPLLEDEEWRIRAAAIRVLRANRNVVAIPPLIAMLEREKGRLVDDAHAALEDLCDKKLPADHARWVKWWDRNKLGFKVPSLEEVARRRAKEKEQDSAYDRAPRDGGYPPYHGIKTRSRKILFVLDVSASMANRVVIDELDPKAVAAFEERYGTSRVKIDVAREELIEMVAGLKPYAWFNILIFNSEVDTWKADLLPANPGNRNKAIKWLSKLTAESLVATGGRRGGAIKGETNTHAALAMAFDVVKGTEIKKTDYKTAADTIFFLSDGRPSTGKITEPQPLVEWVRELNARALMVIHTISFGNENKALMEMLAHDSGGQAVSVGR